MEGKCFYILNDKLSIKIIYVCKILVQIISFDFCSGDSCGTPTASDKTYSYLSCPDGMAICGMRQKIDKSKQLTAVNFKCCWIAIDTVPMTKGKSF